MRNYFLALSLFALTACSMPATTVRSLDNRPSIAIKGASSNAELIVDGLNMGKAEKFNGDPQTLTIVPGTHKITIVEKGTAIFEQVIFVESELKTITLK